MRGSIAVEGLGKRFRRYGSDRPTSFKEAVLSGFRRSRPERFWGLRGVSFTVAPGSTVGVVGKNGAGKSTLLRLIGGVGKPDEGRVSVKGRIGALLDIGAGLTDDLTGRENVFVAGVIAGMTRSEVARRFDEIVAFAELEEFIDSPLRTYSTGMRMRLGFSVAVHINPDILLVDEALAVGDVAFQQKCLARIAEIRTSGCTIFLVSHDPSQVRALCDEIIYLRDGRAVAVGPTQEVMSIYEASTSPDAAVPALRDMPDMMLESGRSLRLGINRFGSMEAEITDVRILNQQGRRTDSVVAGARLTVELDYRASSRIQGLRASVGINRPDGIMCFDANTGSADLEVPTGPGEHTLRLTIKRLDLAVGPYFIHVGLYERNWEYSYDRHEQAYPLSIVGAGTPQGILNPPISWRVVVDAEDAATVRQLAAK